MYGGLDKWESVIVGAARDEQGHLTGELKVNAVVVPASTENEDLMPALKRAADSPLYTCTRDIG